MSYNKLFYNKVNFSLDGNKIIVEPNFLCPVCGGRPQFKATQALNVNVNRTFDFNKQITFTMPCCKTKITLNVAVHKEKDELPYLCISIPESPIAENWWNPEYGIDI